MSDLTQHLTVINKPGEVAFVCTRVREEPGPVNVGLRISGGAARLAPEMPMAAGFAPKSHIRRKATCFTPKAI